MINYRTYGKSHYKELAIDLFKFSYFMGGINFVDMAYLTMKNISDGRLLYYRKKTGKLINLPLQDEVLDVIAKYNKTGPYIFPVFKNSHKTEQQRRNRLHKVITKVNAALKEIGKELGLPVTLTTYAFR